jgi:hypothetical protein
MTDLLDMVVAAHGGLERWSAVQTIDVALSITGVVWYVKGRPRAGTNLNGPSRISRPVRPGTMCTW